ncbi:MAG: adenylate/guanylate cyclase domain-containing protein [Rugosibacter sp.]|nr:MAG: adenylate/guanylate cyclase domain-containing protein [Rugosibacter sp.]
MSSEKPPPSFVSQLLNAGITSDDSEEVRLNKSLLMLATGLFTMTAMLWPMIYSALGKSFSTTLPLLFQLILTCNMLLYIKTRNFDFFRVTQLGVFLFLPFVTQWAIGNFISSSGVILWALIAPIGALLCIGASQSVGWFIAWAALTAISGAMDYYLADPLFSAKTDIIPIRTSLIFFAINFIAVAASIYLLLRYSILEKRKMQKRLEETYAQLMFEQERAENLLLNILPAPVADRLRNTNQTIADGFADVTVMFADIVNFTQLAASLSPNQVFTTLNQIFSAFDELAEKYGLEKIKTIGDAYMIAGGLDNNCPDYAHAIADMAIEMNATLSQNRSINPLDLGIRIGIGTGPLIAGVVGKKKFIYDLWGDTVNIASRITSEGLSGMIQCDATTYRRLARTFDFDGPKTTPLKGKGNVDIYSLIGRKIIYGQSLH